MKPEQLPDTLTTEGASVRLSVREHAEMKATLLAHAKETLRHAPHLPTPTRLRHHWLHSVAGASAALVIFATTTYAANTSLPGEPLYAIKVHVVEEIVALTKQTPEEQLDYTLTRMEHRLEELKLLATDPSPATTEAISDLQEQVVAHITSAREVTETPGLSYEDKIDGLTRLAAITEAQKSISDPHKDLITLHDNIQASADTVHSLRESAIVDFVETQPVETVTSYITKTLDEIGTLALATTTAVSTQEVTAQHLNNADEALTDDSLTETLKEVSEAQRDVIVDAYLEKAPAAP